MSRAVLEQAIREAAARVSPAVAAARAREDERREDWIGRCPACGERKAMTLAQARTGRCASCAKPPARRRGWLARIFGGRRGDG